MKKTVTLFMFVITAILVIVNAGEACDWCLLSQGISPLETFKGHGVRITERYTLLKSVYTGTDEITNPGAREEYWTTEFTIFHGITENLMLMGVVPLRKTKLDGHLHVHEDGEVEVHSDMKGEEFGLGDIAILGRYTFFERHTIDTTTALAVLLGVKLPTGRTGGKTEDGAEFLDAHLQLGTGSTDFLSGISLQYAIRRFSLVANLLAAITTEGKAGDTEHQFGNILNYDLTGKYRLYPGVPAPAGPQLFFALGVNGELRGREKKNGAEVANSGGNTVYLSPGFQVVMPPHWIFELSYQHPIYHNLYGSQLGEDYKAVGGVTYLF